MKDWFFWDLYRTNFVLLPRFLKSNWAR